MPYMHKRSGMGDDGTSVDVSSLVSASASQLPPTTFAPFEDIANTVYLVYGGLALGTVLLISAFFGGRR